MTDTVWTGRHPGTSHFEKLFGYSHLPAGPLRDASAACNSVACQMVGSLSDSPELSAGLRKLLEAKDCFVRAAL